MKYYITWLDGDSNVIADIVVNAVTLLACMDGIAKLMQEPRTRKDIQMAEQISFNLEPPGVA